MFENFGADGDRGPIAVFRESGGWVEKVGNEEIRRRHFSAGRRHAAFAQFDTRQCRIGKSGVNSREQITLTTANVEKPDVAGHARTQQAQDKSVSHLLRRIAAGGLVIAAPVFLPVVAVSHRTFAPRRRG